MRKGTHLELTPCTGSQIEEIILQQLENAEQEESRMTKKVQVKQILKKMEVENNLMNRMQLDHIDSSEEPLNEYVEWPDQLKPLMEPNFKQNEDLEMEDNDLNPFKCLNNDFEEHQLKYMASDEPRYSLIEKVRAYILCNEMSNLA